MYYECIAHNSGGDVISTIVQLAGLLPIPAGTGWVMNFQMTNNNNAGVWVPQYTGWGLLWDHSSTNRSWWNPIGQTVVSNLTDLADNGTNHLGVRAVTHFTSAWSAGQIAGAHIQLLDMNAQVLGTNCLWGMDPPQQGTNSTGAEQYVRFTAVPNGTYNLLVYCTDGTYNDRGTEGFVNGIRQAVTNAQDAYFATGDNIMTWTGLPVNNGTLTATFFSVPAGVRSSTGLTTNSLEGDINGFQLQQVSASPYYPITMTNVLDGGTNLIISWVQGWGTLYSATNVLGPWVPAATNSPFVVPITNIPPQQFFRVRAP